MSIGELNFPRAIILTTHNFAYEAFLSYFPQSSKKEQNSSPYGRGSFSATIYSWDVITINIGFGNVNIALEALETEKPSVILLVGVADEPKGVQLGDVVVATKVYAYKSGKVGQTFQTRPEVINPPNHLVRLARREARKKDWLRRLKEPSTSSVPKVVFAPIASTDSDPYEPLRSNYPDIEALSIHGISNLIDNNAKVAASNDMEKIAAQNASAFAFEILAKLVVTKFQESIENDKPAESIEDDKLGFVFYVEALKDFITSQDTTTPLTISINGPWGTGKSSLMNMLKKELDPFERVPWPLLWQELIWYMRYFSTSPLAMRHQPMSPPFHPTVWFNAWKFSQEEQIWAALATEVLNQLDKKYPWPLRFIFKLRLMRERFTLGRAVGHIALNLLPIGLSYILYHAYLSPYVVPFLAVHLLPLFQTVLSWFPHANPQTAAAQTANSAGIVVWTVAAITTLVTKFKQDKVNPFKIPLKDLLDPPQYEEKIGFIAKFEEDFEHIVNVITQRFSKAWESRKLVIFIDDLDRCRPPQVVSIIEAISLFLDSKQCVFVIGMDPAAIVTSIEDKYKDLVAKIRKETPGIVTPGSLFLDKIIQIPFNTPRPTPEDISDLVEEIIYAKDKQFSSPSLSPTSPDKSPPSPPMRRNRNNRNRGGAASVAGSVQRFQRTDVQNAIKAASGHLRGNPRMIKRFINLFWLKVHLAEKLTLLRGQSLTPLAIAVAWSMRWPEVTKLLLDEAHNRDVSTFLADICTSIDDDNGEWKGSTPAQDGQLATPLGYDRVLSDLADKRTGAEKFPAHWYHLPWQEWISDKDFRCCLKHMEKEQLWQQLKTGEDTPVGNALDLVQLMRL